MIKVSGDCRELVRERPEVEMLVWLSLRSTGVPLITSTLHTTPERIPSYWANGGVIYTALVPPGADSTTSGIRAPTKTKF